MSYENLQQVARGSGGEVYRAWDPLLERPVALKFLLRSDPESLERFFRGARAQAQVDHPNVCRIYQVDETEGRPYIAMEYLKGEELTTAARTLDLRGKLELMRQVAAGVAAAHAQSLTHRDLKPANLWVTQTEDGPRAVVLDFGLAKQEGSETLTTTGEIVGTASYLAPEQARGDREAIGPWTDVYALGCVLYELVAGRPPFVGESFVEVAQQVLSTAPPPLDRLAPGVPEDLARVVMRCLEKEPSARLASAAELGEELERILEGRPVETRPRTPLGRWRHWRRSNPVAGAAVGLGVLALLAAGAMIAWSRWERARQARLVDEMVTVGKDMEWAMRAVYALPKHSIKLEKQRLRGRIREVEEKLPGLPAAAAGPAHYAIGQGLLWLQERVAAQVELKKAWDLDYRTPEVAYARGLVALRLHRTEQSRLDASGEQDTSTAQQRVQALRREADTLLESVRDGDVRPAGYVDALLLDLEGRYGEARAKLAAVLPDLPWLYEGRLLEATILRVEAMEARNRGDREAYRRLLEESQAAVDAAIEAAPSAPEARLADCALQSFRSEAASTSGLLDQVAPIEEKGVRACLDAIEVDDELAEGHYRLAWFYRARADRDTFGGGSDGTNWLDKARESARRALEIAPEDSRARLLLGLTASSKAAFCIQRLRCDPQPALAEAAANLDEIVKTRPLDFEARYALGELALYQADYGRLMGKVVDPILSDALEAYEKVSNFPPGASVTPYVRGLLRWNVADALARRNEPFAEPARAAMVDFESLVTNEPEEPGNWICIAYGHELLARLDLLEGRDPRAHLQAALDAVERADALRPNFLETVLTRAKVLDVWARTLLDAGEPAEAEIAGALAAYGRALDLEHGAGAARIGRLDLILATAAETVLAEQPAQEVLATAEPDLDALSGRLWPVPMDVRRLRYHTYLTLTLRPRGPRGARELAKAEGETESLEAFREGEPSVVAEGEGLVALGRARRATEPAQRKAEALKAAEAFGRAAVANPWQAKTFKRWQERARQVASK